MYIIAGLGNPGREYEKTRHNAGFEVLDRLAAKLEVSNWEKKHKALAGKAMYAGEKLLLLKPQTYMNLSGESLLSAAAFYRVTPDHILVISDDIDLAEGRLRIRKSGSAGGHNGLKSISQALGTRDYIRLRCGIGRPPGRQDPADFVLSPFSARERADLGAVIEEAADAAVDVLARGLTAAQMRLHTDRG